MFQECTSLKKAPKLPAKTLASACYYDMFQGCISLVNAPDLPAETLAPACYFGMFERCTSLVKAPKLPAKTLFLECYMRMFSGCSKLAKAPDLPAKILTEDCYREMFSNCLKLDYINVGFNMWVIGIPTTSAWLTNTAKKGTFISSKNLHKRYGNDFIPKGWIEGTVAINSIKLSRTSLTLKKKSQTYKIGTKFNPSNASNKKLVYRTSNKKVATVNSKGVIKAIKNGTAKITVEAVNGMTKTIVVKVRIPIAVKSIKLSKTKLTLKKKNQTYKIGVKFSPSNATNKKLKFSSSNKKVASVSKTGVIKAKKNGTAKITVKTVNGKKKTIKVTVKY